MNDLIRTEHCRTMTSKIATFRSNDRFCDIDVHVDGKVFRCHRVVLSAASEYFDVMFNGNFKEGNAMEVTLQETKANVFEGILEFIYTGEASIRESEVYDMIRAAEFYKLPLVLELCTNFVEENLNVVADRVLQMFSFARDVGMDRLSKLLRKNIYENFAYFSNTPEFVKLSFDDLLDIINLLASEKPAVQDAFSEGIYSWIMHNRENLTAREIESYSNKFFNKINVAKLSIEYTRYRMRRSVLELASNESTDDDNIPIGAFKKKSVHAYVSRISQDGLSCGTSIFTAYVNRMETYTWEYSRELECFADFMRNTSVDGRLYSLRYAKERQDTINGPQQIFITASSESMYPYKSLKPPPCVLDKFDMCGKGNNIYAYNKDTPRYSNDTVQTIEDLGFSQEELSNGLYVYKRDVDQWFPLPCPKTRFVNACMTCDNQGIIYLIGGSNSDKCVQTYDPRMPKWSVISSTNSVHDGAACCSSGRKIYVAGGQQNPTSFEMYEPVSGNWQNLKDLAESRFGDSQLLYWYVPRIHTIVSLSRTLSADSSVLTYETYADKWFHLPNLFNAVSDSNLNLPSTYSLCILDMVSF